MSSMRTTIKDGGLRYLAAGIGPTVIDPVLDQANDDIVDLAQLHVAVDTGETKRSIRRVGNSVMAGGAIKFLEFGTYKMHPRPVLGPAFSEVSRDVPNRITRALTRAISGRV